MSLNKKMHPRNIYKVPPNFKELALENDEFRQFAKVDIRGKVSIDFKDPGALRALTRALLSRDWKLDVVIPPDKLVPTLPLRLNYILWIEDMLKLQDTANPVHGIDIGTGASCIYPLLAARKNSWHMIGTEKDEDCYVSAKDNVLRNNLQSFITVLKVSGKTIFNEVFENSPVEDGFVCHFSVCNPPFFGSDEEMDANKSNRSQNRALPHNARTGSPHEVAVTGGEVAFVLQMIDESLLLKTKIGIFSTMLGHKASVGVVLNALRERNVKNVARTEFCQGRVTRWGIAWSFIFPLSQAPSCVVPSAKKQKPPLRYEIPPICVLDGENQLNATRRRVIHLLDQLEMQYKQIARGVSSYAFEVTAHTNTWSNQRRKRREKLHNKNKTSDLVSEVNDHDREVDNNQTKLCSTNAGSSTLAGKLSNPSDDQCEGSQNSSDRDQCEGSQNSSDRGDEPPCKKRKSDDNDAPLLVVSVVLHEESLEGDVHRVVMEMDLLKDTCNREVMHQVMQYFRNNLCD